MRAVEVPHAPELEQLEQAADLVRRELDLLLSRAGALMALRQDLETEIAAGSSPAIGQYTATAHDLRRIALLLTMAQADLVHPDDRRHTAAGKVRGWAVDAMRCDGPWKAAA